jgi:hypothetical protein
MTKAADDLLKTLWRRLKAEHPQANQAELRRLFVETAMADPDLVRAAVTAFIEDELRRRRH